MTTVRPLVSLGLTVKDGGYLLSTMLNSILAQSFRNFELIILDNASTDQTEAISKRYAAKDSRIRYYRQENPQQEILNRNFVLNLAAGAYFKFITFEEAVIPNAIEQYVELMRDRSGELVEHHHSFSPLADAPEEPLLSKETIMYQQEPEEWLSDKINNRNEN